MLPVNEAEHAQINVLIVPFKAIAPGLIAIVLIDLLAVTGRWSEIPNGSTIQRATLLLVPWLALAVTGQRPQVLGFECRNLLLDLGWGAVAGGIWRGASLLFNSAFLGLSPGNSSLWTWVSALAWIPFLEETFFRGYLGRGLRAHLGAWKAILIQATLFTLQPSHLAQGLPGIVSILGFGLLAGWLVERRGSIWPAWGAHAMANGLTIPLGQFV
jgi:membrane protease YdiL (CAAX protease family)